MLIGLRVSFSFSRSRLPSRRNLAVKFRGFTAQRLAQPITPEVYSAIMMIRLLEQWL